MAPINEKNISVRLLTHMFFVCAGLLLAGCGSQQRPTTWGADNIPLQNDSLASDQDTYKLDEESSNETLIPLDEKGDETSLLATETIDPEADETAVTIVILPQKRDADIKTSQKISDGQKFANAPSKEVIKPSNETVIPTLKRTLHPDVLIDMTALEVKTRIGRADFIRQEGIVITWQYRMPACVIDLFITFDQETPREGIVDARIDDMKISGAYMRTRIHNSPFKETDCLEAFSERQQPAN